MLVGCITSPETLNKSRRSGNLAIEVLLTLLLLNLQGEARTEDALKEMNKRLGQVTNRRKGEKGNGEDGEARSDDSTNPRLWDYVAVAENETSSSC